MTKQVHITDVGPRDGLQNQATIVPPEGRLRLIQALIDAGLKSVEVCSFVSPKAVPAMAGAGELVAGLPGGVTRGDIEYSALVPNLKGFELARAAGVSTIEIVVAASDTFNRENIRMSNEEAMQSSAAIIAAANNDGADILACVSTAWECPFEGSVSADSVLRFAEQMLEFGAARVVIADTIGAANPGAVHSLCDRLANELGAGKLACHFHDTRGMGVANTYAAYEAGIRHFDASVGGLGGCPFAPGASGNVATEDIALMFEQMGVNTGIDLAKLVVAADVVGELVNLPTGGNSSRWLKRQIEKGMLN